LRVGDTVPSDVETYFGSLYARLPEAKPVGFRDIPGWKSEQNDCHLNVDSWVRRDSKRSAVRGWLSWGIDPRTERCKFMAHSVIEEDGEMYDITPLDPNTPRAGLVFLRHIGTDEEFDILKMHWSDVAAYPFFTYADLQNLHTSDNLGYEE
jgi:hypothetical protein